MAGIKIVDLPPLGRDLASTDLLELSLAGGTGSRKITGQEIMNTSKLNIGTTAITSGTVGRVLFEGTGNVVQESANLTWDNTNGIFNVVGRINAKSTTAQPSSLIVEGTTGVNSGNAGFVVRTGTGYQATFFAADSLAGQGIAGLGIFSGSATPFGLQTGAPNGAFFIHNNGNIGIGTSYTNAGFRLDVNGTARVQGNAQFGTGFYWDNTNSRLGIGTSSPSTTLHVVGQATISTALSISGGFVMTEAGNVHTFTAPATNRTIRFITNSQSYSLFSTGNFAINTTTDDGFRLDVNGTARVSGAFRSIIGASNSNTYLNTIDITQTGNIQPSSFPTMGLLITGTYTDVNPSNNTLYNPFLRVTPTIDFSGSTINIPGVRMSMDLSPIYFATGSRDINSGINILNITPSFTARNVNNITGILYNPTFTVSSNNTHRAIHTVTGNVLLGSTSGNVLIGTTTDAGFKLDVNGTARSTSFRLADSTFIASEYAIGGTTLTILNGGHNISVGVSSTSMTGIRGTALTGTGGPSSTFSCGVHARQVQATIANPTIGLIAEGAIIGEKGVGVFNQYNTSSILQVDSTTKGFLPPRMTQTQRNAIASPAIGLEIYQTDATEGKYIYKSSGWTYIG